MSAIRCWLVIWEHKSKGEPPKNCAEAVLSNMPQAPAVTWEQQKYITQKRGHISRVEPPGNCAVGPYIIILRGRIGVHTRERGRGGKQRAWLCGRVTAEVVKSWDTFRQCMLLY